MKGSTILRLGAAFLALAALAFAAQACSGGDNATDDAGAASPSPSAAAGGLSAVVISSDVVVGANRFMVGLLENNEPVTDAEAQFGFFKLQGDVAELRLETDATTLKMTRGITVENPDGTRKLVEAGEVAAYVADVELDEAGDWGLRVTGTRAGETFGPIQIAFTVAESSQSVAVGQPAPRSVQLTLDDVADLSEIDTSVSPDPEWHQTTIADAVQSGKPVAIVFSTPGFCQTQMCAPMTEELAMLYESYKDRVIFIHVEPYELDKARSGEALVPIDVMGEWGLQTEPWIFVVDADGNVAAKFEAFVMVDEIESALKQALGEDGGMEMQ